jgi:hypothetical protein
MKKEIALVTLILSFCLSIKTMAQSGSVNINNHTAFDVQIILEGSDNTYAGANSWLQSNPIVVGPYSGWVPYDPCSIQALVGWAICTFTSYSCSPAPTPTVLWCNARIILAPGTGCTSLTGCLTDPCSGTFGTCPSSYGSCGTYAVWTNTAPTGCVDGDDITIEIF